MFLDSFQTFDSMQIPENFTNVMLEEEENKKKDANVDKKQTDAAKLDTSDKENDSPGNQDDIAGGKKMKFMLSGFDDDEKNRYLFQKPHLWIRRVHFLNLYLCGVITRISSH
jgi:hypothetical protein